MCRSAARPSIWPAKQLGMIARDCAAEAVPCDHKTLEMAGAGPDHSKSAARVHSGSMHPASAGSRCGCNVTSRLWVLSPGKHGHDKAKDRGKQSQHIMAHSQGCYHSRTRIVAPVGQIPEQRVVC
mmetsp:Transcript_103339/g.166571  ORF Transcript_103339/g.166571 Transcript_103339/m.166571 type:complete len:125 (-) Transcript_103339:170-544(-)